MGRGHKRNADDLPEDDDAAIRELTGGSTDDFDAVERRLRKAPAKPKTRLAHVIDDAQERLDAAVEVHTPAKQVKDKLRQRAEGRVDMMKSLGDKVGTAEDLPEEFIIVGLISAAQDSSRPSVQLQALKTLAEMKGLFRPDSTGETSKGVADLFEELIERRKVRGPRPIDDTKTG